jgi:hypothetical protein
MISPDMRYWTTKAHSASVVGICYGVGGGVVSPQWVPELGMHSHSLAIFGLTPGACASRFGAAPAELFSPFACSLPVCIQRYTTYVASRCPGLRCVLLRQRTGMTAFSLSFLLYETLEVGEARDVVPNLLSMVSIRWLDIVCLYDLSFTTMSTQLVK